MLRNALARSRFLLREEGLPSLLRHATAFGGVLGKRVYRRRDVFLYHHHLAERDARAFQPRLEEFELHIVKNDAEADRDISEWQRIGFEEEDKPILEAVQKLMGTADLMSQKPVLLSPDGAAMRARRIMENLIAREASAGQETRTMRAV